MPRKRGPRCFLTRASLLVLPLLVPEDTITMLPEDTITMLPEGTITMLPENTITMLPEKTFCPDEPKPKLTMRPEGMLVLKHIQMVMFITELGNTTRRMVRVFTHGQVVMFTKDFG